MKDYMERETAVASKRVQDAETAIIQELKDMTTNDNLGATTEQPKTRLQEVLNAFGDSLSDFASSDDEQNGENKEDDGNNTEHGKRSDDDKPGWVIGKISKTVQHHMESFWQKQIRLDELTQPGWGDAVDYFRERDMKYRTAAFQVPAVVKLELDLSAATPSPTTFGEHMQTLHIVRGQSQMLAVTSQPGSGQMRLGLKKPQSHKFIRVLSPDVVTYSMPIQDAKHVEPVSCYPCMKHP